MSGPPLPPSAPGALDAADAERDAWLGAALRHAPDADASPPESLRKTILDEARAAAFASTQLERRSTKGTSAAASGASRPAISVATLWAWLARPAVATGFASVMAATLVGVMWWDRPLDETLTSPTPPVAALHEAPAAEQRTAAAPAAAAVPVPSKAPTGAAVTADVETKKRVGQFAERRRSDAPASAAEAEEPGRGATALAKLLAPTAPATRTPMPAALPPMSASPPPIAAAPQSFPVPVTSTATSPLEKTAPAIRDEMSSLDEPKAGSARNESRRAAPTARAALAPSAASTLVAPAAAPTPGALAGLDRVDTQSRTRQAYAASVSAASVHRPLDDVLVDIAADPSRWSVQRASGDRVAMNDAWRAWLARVDATKGWSASRTVADAAPPVEDRTTNAFVAEPGTTLTLVENGQARAVVRVGADHVVVELVNTVGRVSSSAPLSADAAAGLLASVPLGAR